MSSKMKTTATEEGARPALVPKLRFPEFREAKAWASEPMSEVYTFKGNNSLSRDKLNYVAGSVKNIHYGDIHTKFSTHFDITKELVPFINESEEGVVRDENLCAEGDMIFADASEDMADIGKSIEVVSLNGERVVSGLHTILARRTGDRIALGFGGHLFKSRWVRTQIQKEAQGAKVLGISANRMRNLRLPLPHVQAEQQKIAECLSSVDALMAALARKVDALKTHKKGLMQQLFPREGETQPRLRFPEFENAGEWVVKPLGELVELQSGFAFSSSNFGSRGRKLVTPKNFTKHGHGNFDESVSKYTTENVPERFVCKRGDLLVLLTDLTPTCELLGKPLLLEEQDGIVLLNQRVVRVEASASELATLFLKYVFLSESYNRRIIKTATGSTVRHSSNKVLLETPVAHPSLEEQHRIASCLTSLDALITAETQKLEALKTHKKALMQQLFPSPETVEA